MISPPIGNVRAARIVGTIVKQMIELHFLKAPHASYLNELLSWTSGSE